MKDQLDAIKYEAFFDELSQLEKKAMLNKVAVGGLLSQIVRGGKQIIRNPSAAGRAMSKAWKKGVAGTASDAGGWAKGLAGLKGVAGTPQGKAALTAGGAALAGVGGVGYLAGRQQGGQGQNVYVR